jgi:hypothetical protein
MGMSSTSDGRISWWHLVMIPIVVKLLIESNPIKKGEFLQVLVSILQTDGRIHKIHGLVQFL